METRDDVKELASAGIQRWLQGIDWLQQRVREIQRLYPQVETGRGKNQEALDNISNAFNKIYQSVVKDYNENRGFLDLVHKEKGVQLHRREAIFNDEDKIRKAELAEEMNKEIFMKMIRHLEEIYKEKQDKYCSTMFGKNKSPIEYAKYLNENSKNHHFVRMIAVTLKDIYTLYPELDENRFPVKQIHDLPYKFSPLPKAKHEKPVQLTS